MPSWREYLSIVAAMVPVIALTLLFLAPLMTLDTLFLINGSALWFTPDTFGDLAAGISHTLSLSLVFLIAVLVVVVAVTTPLSLLMLCGAKETPESERVTVSRSVALTKPHIVSFNMVLAVIALLIVVTYGCSNYVLDELYHFHTKVVSGGRPIVGLVSIVAGLVVPYVLVYLLITFEAAHSRIRADLLPDSALAQFMQTHYAAGPPNSRKGVQIAMAAIAVFIVASVPARQYNKYIHKHLDQFEYIWSIRWDIKDYSKQELAAGKTPADIAQAINAVGILPTSTDPGLRTIIPDTDAILLSDTCTSTLRAAVALAPPPGAHRAAEAGDVVACAIVTCNKLTDGTPWRTLSSSHRSNHPDWVGMGSISELALGIPLSAGAYCNVDGTVNPAYQG